MKIIYDLEIRRCFEKFSDFIVLDPDQHSPHLVYPDPHTISMRIHIPALKSQNTNTLMKTVFLIRKNSLEVCFQKH